MKNAGLIIVVIVICMAGVITTFSNLYSTAMNGTGEFPNEGYATEEDYYVWTREINEPLDAIERAKFDTVNGKIEVEAHEDPTIDTAEIFAKIKIKPSFLAGKNAALEAKRYYDVTAEKDQQTLTVQGVHPKWKPKGVSNVSIEFKIKIPQRLHADVHTINGKIAVKEIQGELIVSTVNGSVTTEQCPNLNQAESINGSIKLSGLHTVKKIETVNGSIHAFFDESPQNDARMTAVNGSIQLRFPKEAHYNLHVETSNGGIHFDKDLFTGTQKKRYAKGTINGGGAVLSVETVNGSVSFQNGSVPNQDA